MKTLEEKKWIVGERTRESIVEQLLVNRGVPEAEWESFLNLDYERDLGDPFLMKDMRKAVDRIKAAISNREKVGVFGDYDADGLPGTALIVDVLERHGLDVFSYIPKREEGYGLSEAGIEVMRKEKVSLMLTVDLGITGKREVDLANKYKIEVIITDHHEIVDDKFPKNALAVINPKQCDCQYPFKQLSGAAVVFKLACALCAETGLLSKDKLKWYLDLVGISTFCDMVPLVGENRLLAKYGLIVLQKTKRAGLLKLYEKAGIDKKSINPYMVGFLIGPRLNAPGRMGNCNDALALLQAKNEETAEQLAEKLEKENIKRQNLLKKVLEEADGQVNGNRLFENKVIIVDKEGWPEGVIGLVSGRITEKYNRPSIVIGYRDGMGKGSARSIDGFHLVRALEEVGDLLIKFGGHEKAAGLTISYDMAEEFKSKMRSLADAALDYEALRGKILCDMEAQIVELRELYPEIKKLEPFGLGNNKPVFVSRDVNIFEVKNLGSGGQHISFKLGVDQIEGVGFNMGERMGFFGKPGVKYDIVYTLDENEWRGRVRLQVKLIDFKKSG